MRLLIAALWLLAGSAVAGLFDQPVSASDGRLLALTAALQQPLIRASYEQSRQLRLLKQPLQSSGTLLVVPGQAVILRQLLASMRQAKLGDDMMGSSATDNFREMADARTADSIAAMRQFGIADMVERQFRGATAGGPSGLGGGVQ